ncbi:response regulator [Pseudomonas plecoglossicida]|uniref:histidine kinase n=2 Tax=Pseudomonas plecoglossicida TaxID=70775 RepID=A0AAD0VUK6_PSEDL|nr:ATP-binding protein [Pseudomonas plecoglossicida]AXM98219.1 hybrid sensor histidine kinase/response regulator [Pseudomonas plecoglossicida]EPB97608.1 sensor histidine kinase/response regulator [Pseudomonas plecoglossicida NB2011]QLB57951.1 response regulator [Pseudomonas plecoglossicida]
MKLKQFLLPSDACFSTPKAARRLLRLFAQLMVLGALAGAVMTVGCVLNAEVSRRQGYMADAIIDTRVFFTQREALLRSLALLAVKLPGDATEGSAGRVLLSERTLEFLRQYRVNLLQVSGRSGRHAAYLSMGLPFTLPLSDDIVRRLRTYDVDSPFVTQGIWLADHSSSRARLYLFTLLDRHRPAAGWIGMEMDASDITSTLHDDKAGQFMVVNPVGEVMMSSADPARDVRPLLAMPPGKDFGFSGAGWLPDQLVMRKKLGYSSWTLFYVLDLFTLLKVICWPLAISLLAILAVGMAVRRLVSRVERRLITPATRRIDALIESEAFSRAVIQAAPVALCVLRFADGKVVLENRLSQQWLGECNERERLYQGWIGQAFDESQSSRADEFQAGSGRHLYPSFVKTRYNGEDVLFCAFSDISSRKQMEAAMAEAKLSADAANEAKTLFLATMSHEIRTPLYGVLGTLELLRKTELKTQQKTYLKAVESSSSALLNLVCDVLDVSKIEAGQLALDECDFKPLELVYHVIQSYAGAARGKGLHLYAYVDPQVPQVLFGDVTRIRQVLNNLLGNAVKFTDSGQVVLRVRAAGAEGGRFEVHWQVSDSGPGIAEQDQAFLFDPFYQTGVNANTIAGTGLGLSICQRLAGLMNGVVRVVSTPGLGSSFTLVVGLKSPCPQVHARVECDVWSRPVNVYSPVEEMARYIGGWLNAWGAKVQFGLPEADPPASETVLVEVYPCRRSAPHVAWGGARIVVSPDFTDEEPCGGALWQVRLSDLDGLLDAFRSAQGSRWLVPPAPVEVVDAHESRKLSLKVLVVEDNVINQLILKNQLEVLGCQVTLASDGSQALLLWDRDCYDVVLTDINMPGMSGYELASQLRDQGCQVPIIGATANAMSDEGDRCMGAGMQELLVKPFGLKGLFDCLQHYEKVSDCGV